MNRLTKAERIFTLLILLLSIGTGLMVIYTLASILETGSLWIRTVKELEHKERMER